MEIRSVMIGNEKEAFVENRFKKGLNIISSDDNNKGKTIVIQSMMYAMGNEPIFPSSFPYEEYYHVVEFEQEGKIIKICRKKNTFVVIKNGNLHLYDSLPEFKRFLKNNIFELPVIVKKGMKKIVDPVLFFQIFFVGQDKKNTSTIFNNGYYNNQDFINMLYSYLDIPLFIDDDINQDAINRKITSLKAEKELLKQENKILKSNTDVSRIVNLSADRYRLEEQLRKIDKLKNEIINLVNYRNRAITRRLKNEVTLKELRSLNQTLSVGELYCIECKSTNIGYTTKGNNCAFDVSSIEIRNQIIESIKDRIDSYTEEIDNITDDINNRQLKLKEILSVDDVNLESILFMKSDISTASNADKRIMDIDKEIKDLKESIKIRENNKEEFREKKNKLYKSLSDEMYKVYRIISPDGNLNFEGLFSKRNDVYSGSEGNEFYIAKMISLANILKHNYPIIIDCYRDGELSSVKEERVLNIIRNLKNQVILTVTLKEEENNKYSLLRDINNIKYDNNEVCKLLNKQDVEDLQKQLEAFAIIL